MSNQLPGGFVPDGFVPDSAPADEGQGDAITRAATEFYNKSPLAPAVAALKGAAHVAAHPLDTWLGALPIAQTVKDAAKAQWNQAVIAAQKTKDALTMRDPLSASEAIGHGLAAVIPLLGPAAADVGEHGAKGDVAGMVGGALGLLSPFAAHYGLDLKIGSPEARAAKAEGLEQQAATQVKEQVLAPGNPRYKPTATRIAPEVLSRGLQGTRDQLRQTAQEGMADATTRIDSAAKIDPQEPIDLKPVVQALNDEIDALKPTGSVPPGMEHRVAALQAQRDFVLSEAEKQTGSKTELTLPFEQVRGLRQVLDRQAAEGQVYSRVDPQHPASIQAKAAAEAAGALRDSIAKGRPEIVQPNADYAFFKALNDVLDPDRGRPKQTNYVPSGITGGMSTTGAVIGQAMSNVPGLKAIGALVGSQVLPKIKAALASPEFQLMDATKKMKLAEDLRSGSVGRVQRALITVSALAPRAVPMAAAMPLPAAASNTPDQGR